MNDFEKLGRCEALITILRADLYRMMQGRLEVPDDYDMEYQADIDSLSYSIDKAMNVKMKALTACIEQVSDGITANTRR